MLSPREAFFAPHQTVPAADGARIAYAADPSLRTVQVVACLPVAS